MTPSHVRAALRNSSHGGSLPFQASVGKMLLLQMKFVLTLCPQLYMSLSHIAAAISAADSCTGCRAAHVRHLSPVQVSMPTSPTWMAYAGDHVNCIDAVPIAIQRGTFCNVYLGQVQHSCLLNLLPAVTHFCQCIHSLVTLSSLHSCHSATRQTTMSRRD